MIWLGDLGSVARLRLQNTAVMLPSVKRGPLNRVNCRPYRSWGRLPDSTRAGFTRDVPWLVSALAGAAASSSCRLSRALVVQAHDTTRIGRRRLQLEGRVDCVGKQSLSAAQHERIEQQMKLIDQVVLE